ncbi:MAG: ATP-binding protein [Ilumatobacteraceae bacterium]
MQLGQRLTWQLATAVGIGGLVGATILMRTVLPDAPTEVPALVLLVPVTAASILSSWRVGLPLAALGATIFGIVFLPPFGTVRIGFTQDLAIQVTFVLVAVSFSVIVSRRSLATRAELIGEERMHLLRSVAHDVRSPLQAILTASTELDDGADYDPVTRKELLGVVIEETLRLTRITDNLLNLSRLQAGALVPGREPVPVWMLLEQCQARFALLGRPGDVLDVDDDTGDTDVDVDPVHIDQVLCNLVENAVRHCPSPLHVTLTARRVDDLVEMCVGDDGPGFSAAARREIFTPFRSERGSSGLGLTLCRGIVDAHGGTITVDDRAGGAAVRFTLPVAH